MVGSWPWTAIREGARAGGTHLRLEERERLAASKAEGLSLRAIARRLGRAASTISRELRRNALPRGGYLPAHAEGSYLERRQRPAVLERDERLGRFVRERLLEGWTPEQIAGWLRRGEERGLRPVVASVNVVEIRPVSGVAIGQAARGGSRRVSASVSGESSSAMASSCM